MKSFNLNPPRKIFIGLVDVVIDREDLGADQQIIAPEPLGSNTCWAAMLPPGKRL